ncbi:MAG: exodeoxyribonuclease III [Spirochaetia bacterium]|nr:exodeoxyribonuclease III [Spirochaetia bacterium]
MKLISWNVNGIRAVERKGEIQALLEKEKPELIFLQEIKAKFDQLTSNLTNHNEYFQHYHSAEKPGYSGVGVWLLKKKFSENYEIISGMPKWKDTEGRVIRVDIKNYTFLGIYFPNGGKSHEAWLEKLKFYDHYLNYINDLRKLGRTIIWAGDLNVAHNEIDLARPKENENNIGFRPEEREWMNKVTKNDWIDCFRYFYPEKVSYTWWQLQTKARERNVGWRIDYFLSDKKIIKKIKNIHHLENQMGSDHCPIVLEVDIL